MQQSQLVHSATATSVVICFPHDCVYLAQPVPALIFSSQVVILFLVPSDHCIVSTCLLILKKELWKNKYDLTPLTGTD